MLGAGLGGPLGGWMNDNFGWYVLYDLDFPRFCCSYVSSPQAICFPRTGDRQMTLMTSSLQ